MQKDLPWFTKTRIVILALSVILVMLIAYQSILAQTFERPTLQVASEPEKAAERAKSLNKTDTRLAAAIELEAKASGDKGNYAESEKLYRKALSIDEHGLGSDNPALIPTLRGLGNSLAHQKKLNEAERILARLVELDKKVFADSDSRIVRDLTSLAAVYLDQKKYNQSRDLFEKALAISKSNFGSNSLEVAVALNNMAMFYAEQKQDAQAYDLYQRANGIASEKKYWMSNDAGLIKGNSTSFWNELKHRYVSNETDPAGKFPFKALEQVAQLKKKEDLNKAEQILAENLDAAAKAPSSKAELAKYLVRFNNVLFNLGKDEEAVMYGRLAAEILDDPKYANDKSLAAWQANLHSYLAMSADRQALNNVPGRAYLLAQAQENYRKALSLCATVGVEDRWTKLIKSGLVSVTERKSGVSQHTGKSVM